MARRRLATSRLGLHDGSMRGTSRIAIGQQQQQQAHRQHVHGSGSSLGGFATQHPQQASVPSDLRSAACLVSACNPTPSVLPQPASLTPGLQDKVTAIGSMLKRDADVPRTQAEGGSGQQSQSHPAASTKGKSQDTAAMQAELKRLYTLLEAKQQEQKLQQNQNEEKAKQKPKYRQPSPHAWRF
eukprot:1155616-Pelagomonas_calceolata.AAC.21